MKYINFFISVVLIFKIEAITGFLYSIKSNEPGGMCYTDEKHKAVAFIRNVTRAGTLSKSGVVEYAPMLPHSSDAILNTMNCDLVHDECESWKKKGFVLKSNVDESIFKNNYFPPVLDRRWNRMDEIITDGTFHYLDTLDLGHEASGKLHFSILAKDTAKIIFFQDNKSKNGILVTIDGLGEKNTASIRECKQIPINGKATGCSFIDKNTIKVLSDGGEWVLITLQFSIRNWYLVGLDVLQGSKTIVSTSLKEKQYGHWWDHWKLAVRSYSSPGIFKMHKYNILRAEDRYAELESDLKIGENRENIYLQVTYHYQNSHQPQPPIKVQIKNIALHKMAFQSELTVKPSNYSWQIQEVMFAALAGTEYKILVIVPKNVSIGAVNFCSGKRDLDLITTPDGDVEGYCQFIGEASSRVDNSNITTNELSIHEAKAFCHKLQYDCEGVQICNNKENCQCLSGFKKNGTFPNCDLRCKDGFYGFECKYQPEGAQYNSVLGLVIIANFIATILINIITVFLLTLSVQKLNNANTEHLRVTYSNSYQEEVGTYSNFH